MRRYDWVRATSRGPLTFLGDPISGRLQRSAGAGRSSAPPNIDLMKRIGLVGCVKLKQMVPAPAADLYISPLFKLRRRYVERSCSQWYILSAKHGLVRAGQVLEPYEQTLKAASRGERRAWSARVVDALESEIGSFKDVLFEIHAGYEYRSFGLHDGIVDGGGHVEVPTEGLPIGEQLAFYKRSLMANAPPAI
jgi:hypothetical protein